jgi:hypothetical protein
MAISLLTFIMNCEFLFLMLPQIVEGCMRMRQVKVSQSSLLLSKYPFFSDKLASVPAGL